LRQLLETKSGLTVVGEAFNTQSAIEQLKVSAPDLAVMNINSAGAEDVVESTRRVLAECSSVRVIALSNSSELEFVLQALRAGVAGFVVTNHGSEELFRAIQAVMESQVYLSPEVSSAVISHFMKSYRGRKPARSGVVLSDRERLLLQLIADGMRNKEIAGEMGVTVKSVETFRIRLMKKLGCSSVAELVRFTIREAIVQA